MIEYHSDLQKLLLDLKFNHSNIYDLAEKCGYQINSISASIDEIDETVDLIIKRTDPKIIGTIFVLLGVRRDGDCFMYCM